MSNSLGFTVIRNVVGKTYRVEADAEMEDSGECSTSKCIIKYDPKMEIQQIRDTIWHEIKHALWTEVALNGTIGDRRVVGEDVEEEVVSRMATAELCVLRSNKKLRDFLFGDEN